MGKVKEKLKNNKIVYNSYYKLKYFDKMTKRYKFINRSKNMKKVCFILAGYKEFLWGTTLDRVNKFIPSDYDVCIISSGLYSEKLNNIAKENNWSYLSVKRNNVSLAQNVAISLFPNADFIMKMDEDIFITDGMVANLERALNDVNNYDVGMVSPTIPINGFGYNKILDFYNLKDFYKSEFENPIYAAGPQYMIENNPNVAKFFWGQNNHVKSIDEMNKDFANEPFNYSPCPIRLSIGCILFKRSFWKDMGMFHVSLNGNDMGKDEELVNSYSILFSKAIIISGNAVAGHLSFGVQNNPMKSFFLKNIEQFKHY